MMWTTLSLGLAFLAGAGLTLAVGWRRLTTPTRAEDTCRLERQLIESDRQVGALLRQNRHLAQRLIAGQFEQIPSGKESRNGVGSR